jgi:hypothetical protein
LERPVIDTLPLNISDKAGFFRYCKLRVLRLGFLQDGEVGVAVFPECKEILKRALALDMSPLIA